MPETPRTWKLRAGYAGAEHRWFLLAASGKAEPFEDVIAVEKAPVDAERERMLDLLEMCHHRLWSGEGPLNLRNEIVLTLREYGRLSAGAAVADPDPPPIDPCEHCGAAETADCSCLVCESCCVAHPGSDDEARADGWMVVRDNAAVLVRVACAACEHGPL